MKEAFAMSDAALHPAVTLRLYTDHKCFGPGVAMLLRRVRDPRIL